MTELVRAEDVKEGHFIFNPLPLKGEGSWSEVTEVIHEDDRVYIKAGRWGVRRNLKEGVTVLRDFNG